METKGIENGKSSFSEKTLPQKIIYICKSFGATAVFPNFMLYHLYKSGSVSIKQKLMIAGAFLYLICPIDLLVDFIPGFVGYADDMVALMAVLTGLATSCTDEVHRNTIDHLRRLLGGFDERGIEAEIKILRSVGKVIGNTPSKQEVIDPRPEPKPNKNIRIEDVEIEEVKPIEKQ